MGVLGWTYLFVSATFVLYIWIGWRSRVAETKSFYVAGQGVPAVANGAATAADWMSAASFLSMAGLISALGHDGAMYLMGWTGGYVLLALLLAPYLRKFGKYTVPDFVGDRYGSSTARTVAVIAAIFVSLTYVAGQMRGVGIVFSRFLEVNVTTGVIIGMAVVAFFSILGGMKGITWTQVAQYSILIIAFLIPAFAISDMLTDGKQIIPQIALVTSEVIEQLNMRHAELGFSAYSAPFTERSMLNVFMITAALMFGTAGLPHVIIRFYTVKSVSAARWSAAWALLFIAVLYTTAPAVAAFARLNLINSLHGQSVEEVQQIEWVDRWQETGLLTIEDLPGPDGAPPDGIVNFAADDSNEVQFDRDIIVLANPEIAGLSDWVIALVAAGGLAAALSTAAALLLVISSAVAHDIYFKLVNPRASEARRVAVGRIMVAVAVLVAGYLGIDPPGFVGQVVAFAFGLAAASFFPVIVLGIFDARTNRQGAIVGMVVGLGFTFAYIAGNKYFGMPTWCFGIAAEGIGTVGMLLNFAVTLIVSRLTPPPPQEIRDMVLSLRDPTHVPEAHEPEEALDH